MGFNLRDKILSAKDRLTDALVGGVLAADAATENAIERASNLGDAAKERINGVKNAITTRVEDTVGAVKEKTTATLDNIGTAIDSRANKVSEAAAEFGAAAKRKLGRKEEVAAAPAAVETPKKKKSAAKVRKTGRKPR